MHTIAKNGISFTSTTLTIPQMPSIITSTKKESTATAASSNFGVFYGTKETRTFCGSYTSKLDQFMGTTTVQQQNVINSF